MKRAKKYSSSMPIGVRQGYRGKEKSVGNHPKNLPFSTALQSHFKISF